MYPRAESNCYQKFRKLLFYPLNYKGILSLSPRPRRSFDIANVIHLSHLSKTLRIQYSTSVP